MICPRICNRSICACLCQFCRSIIASKMTLYRPCRSTRNSSAVTYNPRMRPRRALHLARTKYSTFRRPWASSVKIFGQTGDSTFRTKCSLLASRTPTTRPRNLQRSHQASRLALACGARTFGTSVGSSASCKPRKLAIRSFKVPRSCTLTIYRFITSISSNARQLNANRDLKRSSRCKTTRAAFTLAVRVNLASTITISMSSIIWRSAGISWSKKTSKRSPSRKQETMASSSSAWLRSQNRSLCDKS